MPGGYTQEPSFAGVSFGVIASAVVLRAATLP